MNTDLVISVVSVLEGDVQAGEFVRHMALVLAQSYKFFEILLVDNASDTGVAANAAGELTREVPQLRILRLSRKYDLEVALLAGLDSSLGDFVVLMDPRHDGPELVPSLLEQARAGFDVVIADALETKRHGFWRRLAVSLSMRLTATVLGYPTLPSGDYFRVMSRQVVNSVSKIRNKRRYLKYFNTVAGFRQTHVVYERSSSTALPAQRARDIVLGTVDLILSNSVVPLRIGSLLGLTASFLALCYLLYVLVISLVKNHIAEGWITTSVTTTSMFLFLFLIITILSEYIARIFDETKEQPLYFIDSEISGSTMVPANMLNVV